MITLYFKRKFNLRSTFNYDLYFNGGGVFSFDSVNFILKIHLLLCPLSTYTVCNTSTILWLKYFVNIHGPWEVSWDVQNSLNRNCRESFHDNIEVKDLFPRLGVSPIHWMGSDLSTVVSFSPWTPTRGLETWVVRLFWRSVLRKHPGVPTCLVSNEVSPLKSDDS